MNCCTQTSWAIAPFPGVSRSRLYILGETDEEGPEDGNRTEDNNKPHLCQNPSVQLPNVERYILVVDEGDVDGLVDSGNPCSGEAS